MRVSLVQFCPAWENVEYNLSRLSQLIKPLKGKSDLILLPEMFSTGFSSNIDVICTARRKALILGWMQQEALNAGAMLAGSVAIEENGARYNRFYWIGNDGTRGYYDKNYLFMLSEEPAYFKAGTEKKQFLWRGWKIKPIVCYDLRFPELSRNSSADPYDILVCAASWPSVRSDVWLTLLKARAIENQCYAIGINRVGVDANGLEHAGDSIVYSPKGQTIIKIPENEEKIVTVELSFSELNNFRKKFPVLEDIKI